MWTPAESTESIYSFEFAEEGETSEVVFSSSSYIGFNYDGDDPVIALKNPGDNWLDASGATATFPELTRPEEGTIPFFAEVFGWEKLVVELDPGSGYVELWERHTIPDGEGPTEWTLLGSATLAESVFYLVHLPELESNNDSVQIRAVIYATSETTAPPSILSVSIHPILSLEWAAHLDYIIRTPVSVMYGDAIGSRILAYSGDTPEFEFTLFDKTGAHIDLRGVTIKFRAKRFFYELNYAIDKTCEILDAIHGKCLLSLDADDVETAGEYMAYLIFVRDDETEQTVAPVYLRVKPKL